MDETIDRNNGVNNDLAESMNQIKALSKVFGSEGDDMAQKIAMAKKLSTMMSKNEHKNSTPQSPLNTTGDKKLDILMASMPFVDTGMQRPFSIILNVLQIKHVLNKGTLMTQSIQVPENPNEKRKQLIKAIMPYLGDKERQSINMFMSFMDMNNVMNIMGGGSNNE